MTDIALREILQSDKPLTLQKVKDIIYELKNDCVRFNEESYTAGFYNGEMNAFYICLDLLDKVEDRFKAMGLRRRFDILADLIGLERTADPREILDKTLDIHRGKAPRNTGREIVCPSCGVLIGSHPFCAYCGQAIDQKAGEQNGTN